jgi:hypothetical protein
MLIVADRIAPPLRFFFSDALHRARARGLPIRAESVAPASGALSAHDRPSGHNHRDQDFAAHGRGV